MENEEIVREVERILNDYDGTPVWDAIEDIVNARNVTQLKTIYGGHTVMWANCIRCGNNVNYPTDKPYDFCPYCRARIVRGEDYDTIGL